MDKIGPREAADTIREEFENEHIDPRFLHQVRFSGDVLANLGHPNSVENTAKVMRLLTKHGIEGHAYADFPKWVQNERGERAVVNDEEHEAQFMARPPSYDDSGTPNPEHGHIDPQSGVFHAGLKPVEYDPHEPHIHGSEVSDGLDEALTDELEHPPESIMTGWKPDPSKNRAEQIKEEQDRLAVAEKAAKDERDKLDALKET